MKIRTDFVTNSSSCSFTSWSLDDSALCKYLNEKFEEAEQKYKEEAKQEAIAEYEEYKKCWIAELGKDRQKAFEEFEKNKTDEDEEFDEEDWEFDEELCKEGWEEERESEDEPWAYWPDPVDRGHPNSEFSFGSSGACAWVSHPEDGNFYLDYYIDRSADASDFRFTSKLEDMENFLKDETAKEAFRKILKEECPADSTWDKFLEALGSDMEYGANHYIYENYFDDYEDKGTSCKVENRINRDWDRARCIPDSKDEDGKKGRHLSERLFELFKNSECDSKYVTVESDHISINYDPEDFYSDYGGAESTPRGDRVHIYENRMYLIGFCGYSKEEQQADAISGALGDLYEFTPISQAEEILGESFPIDELFEQDVANGKFSGRVEIGGTD